MQRRLSLAPFALWRHQAAPPLGTISPHHTTLIGVRLDKLGLPYSTGQLQTVHLKTQRVGWGPCCGLNIQARQALVVHGQDEGWLRDSIALLRRVFCTVLLLLLLSTADDTID
jgi:hypothetical protein